MAHPATPRMIGKLHFTHSRTLLLVRGWHRAGLLWSAKWQVASSCSYPAKKRSRLMGSATATASSQQRTACYWKDPRTVQTFPSLCGASHTCSPCSQTPRGCAPEPFTSSSSGSLELGTCQPHSQTPALALGRTPTRCHKNKRTIVPPR